MKLFLIFFFFLFCSCKEEDTDKDLSANTESVPSIALTEHERIVSDLEAKVSDLQKILNRASEEKEAEKIRTGNIIENLEIEIITLNETLSQFRAEIAKSKGSLREIKKIGTKEYKDIFESAKGLDHDKAILLYENFLEQFPDSPISSKARARIKYHNSEIKIIENRSGARTLRVWETKLKGEGMYVRKVSEDSLFQVIGREPDSSKRGSSSEYKERIYKWRDYVVDGGYHDLVIETTDGKVDRIYRPE